MKSLRFPTPVFSMVGALVIIEGTEMQRLKNQAALQLLQAWRTDDAQEHADTWMVIKVALEEDRLLDRLLFR